MVLEARDNAVDLDSGLKEYTVVLKRYLIALVNTAYYVYFHLPDAQHQLKQSTLKETRNEKFNHISQLYERLDNANCGELSRTELKTLVSGLFVRGIWQCSNGVSDEVTKILQSEQQKNKEENDDKRAQAKRFVLEKLTIQLRNCILGFVQIYHFIRKLPVQQQYQISKLQSQILEHELNTDLLQPWARQVGALHSSVSTALKADTQFREKLEQYRTLHPDLVESPIFRACLYSEVQT
ncbi:LADA_0F10022g1_1 [Lachancea dasiensis]|uniref:LADA_0F10022g1_1 n=1 Tax=Lachancea dasiensis TaxID=1072105 RepID=A0A1G4JLK0_9SACH|nr:LADA_0F10022g1_1 [Lachancea dasiensis]